MTGFTALSEELEPEQLTDMINEYLDAMSEIALEAGGTIDKFIGDAVMALFSERTDDALRAAIGARQGLAAFNEAGIPAVCYGARTRDSKMGGGLAGEHRPMAIADLIALAKVYALTALQVRQVEA